MRFLRAYEDAQGFVRELFGTAPDRVRLDVKRLAASGVIPDRLVELADAIGLAQGGVVIVQDDGTAGGPSWWSFPVGETTRTFVEPFDDDAMVRARAIRRAQRSR